MMRVCPNCDVELSDAAGSCPLCGHDFGEKSQLGASGSYPADVLDAEEFASLSPGDRKKIFIELCSICSAIVIFVVAAIDFLMNRGLSWSFYPIASVSLVWLLANIPLILEGRPWLIFSILGPAFLGFLCAVDVIDGRLDWFLRIGLPMALVSLACVAACGTLIALSRRRSLNMIAILLGGVCFLCLGFEISLDLALFGRVNIGWSGVVATACLPISGLFFYLHYRVVRRASLKKLFHL